MRKTILATCFSLLATPVFADGLTENPDGSFMGFPSYIHLGKYCDAVQIYAAGAQYYGVWKDFPSKLTQAEGLQHATVNNLMIKFKLTGKSLGCKDGLKPVLEISDIQFGNGPEQF